MTKRFFRLLTVLCASVLTFAALTVSASACLLGVYQPQEPKLLREE